MTKEEAIKVLKRELNGADEKIFPEVKGALDMAIKALDQENYCPNCGAKMEVINNVNLRQMQAQSRIPARRHFRMPSR